MRFIAKIEEEQKANIQQIVRSLEGMGVEVRRVMKMTGTITGDSGAMKLAEVKIKGIESVERDRSLRTK